MDVPSRGAREGAEPTRRALAGLACTVRGCGRELADEGRRLVCAQGHAFDVARSGYVNVLQPQDRRSLAAGDSKEAVAARAWLEERGFEARLVARVVALGRRLGVGRGARALDVGCGTGRLAAALAGELGCETFAVDLSAAACEHGARRRAGVRFLVANADRRLPFADASIALVTCARGPRSVAEFARVLAPGAHLVLAIPAPDDLVELRARLGGEARLVDREPSLRAALEPAFVLRARDEERATIRLEREGLLHLMRSTYRGARHAERERVAALDALEVTAANVVLLFERTSS